MFGFPESKSQPYKTIQELRIWSPQIGLQPAAFTDTYMVQFSQPVPQHQVFDLAGSLHGYPGVSACVSGWGR